MRVEFSLLGVMATEVAPFRTGSMLGAKSEHVQTHILF